MISTSLTQNTNFGELFDMPPTRLLLYDHIKRIVPIVEEWQHHTIQLLGFLHVIIVKQ